MAKIKKVTYPPVEDSAIRGYCMKEKKKNQKIIKAKVEPMKGSGALAVRGECKSCGTTLFKILSAADKAKIGIE